jgi:hypothetical protein
MARSTHTPKPHRGPQLDLTSRIFDRMGKDSSVSVWTPRDFLNLGSRAAIDKALQRLAGAKSIRRIDRGLYDLPRISQLTGKPAHPDYTAIIEAIARRDQIRLLVDGITAANQLGLTDAVPARVIVHTDARIRPIRLGKLTINFKLTAPKRLYWAGRPAMRVVQALHWLADMLPSDKDSILRRLKNILNEDTNGPAIRQDLQEGIHTLPQWMREFAEQLLKNASAGDDAGRETAATVDASAKKTPQTATRRRTRRES